MTEVIFLWFTAWNIKGGSERYFASVLHNIQAPTRGSVNSQTYQELLCKSVTCTPGPWQWLRVLSCIPSPPSDPQSQWTIISNTNRRHYGRLCIWDTRHMLPIRWPLNDRKAITTCTVPGPMVSAGSKVPQINNLHYHRWSSFVYWAPVCTLHGIRISLTLTLVLPSRVPQFRT